MARKNEPEYRAWRAMKSRCYSPSTKGHGYYQEKGLQVCDRWLHSYENFLADVGRKPDPKFSLDRIDNDLGYFPENCRWANSSEQTKNRGSFNIIITYDDETMVLKDWARKLNIKYSTLYLRITRNKLSFEDAIKEDPFNKLLEFNGKKQKLKDWCLEYNKPLMTVINRMHKHHWTLEEALTVYYEPKNYKPKR